MCVSRKVEVLCWALLGTAIWMPAYCRAQTNCPWMNAATAAGILGGPVQERVTHAGKNSDDATCNFASHQPGANSTLHIAVITMSNPARDFAAFKQQCGPTPTTLQAIGNEAIECSLDLCGGHSARVVGRVRNRVFVVDLHISSRNGTGSAHHEQLEIARHAAEQVSETLY